MLYRNDTNPAIAQWIADRFEINLALIKDGFTYLGFRLKAKGYHCMDWAWLVDRFFFKISRWEMRFLSLAGRYILVQTVLSQLWVFWSHLFILPSSVIKQMKSIVAFLLWSGRPFLSKIHLVKMDTISRPKEKGGWGLLHMNQFGKALMSKSFHRGLLGHGPWSTLIRQKYLKGRPLVFWFKRFSLGIQNGSPFWNSFKKIQPFFLKYLKWTLFSGSSVLIGIDPTLYNLESMIPHSLLSFFHSRGLFTWNTLIDTWSSLQPIWKSDLHLAIPPLLLPLWLSFSSRFSHHGILQLGTKDNLIWSTDTSIHPISVWKIYSVLS